MHESKIILFEAARESLGTVNSKHMIESIFTLKNRILELTLESDKLTAVLTKQKLKISEVNQLKSNLETYLKTYVHRTTEKTVDK